MDENSTLLALPKSHRFENLTGQRFTRLIVLSYAGLKKNRTYWECRCDCGNVKAIAATRLKSAKTKSCGCYREGFLRERVATHRRTKSPEHIAWCSMNQRCTNPNASAFKYYGGRGITVCERWLHSFENFLSDMGEKPSLKHSIERRDVNGEYNPENCYWATPVEQARNKRNNRLLTYNGETRCLTGWADIIGISVSGLHGRLVKWTLAMALGSPPRSNRKSL